MRSAMLNASGVERGLHSLTGRNRTRSRSLGATASHYKIDSLSPDGVFDPLR